MCAFVRWTLSGLKGKHRMAEMLKEPAMAGDNPFSLYGSRREIDGWEFSSTTGFQQNISISQKDLIHWTGNVLQRSIFYYDLLAELRQVATEIHLFTFPTQLESLPHLWIRDCMTSGLPGQLTPKLLYPSVCHLHTSPIREGGNSCLPTSHDCS